jgi:uncharacterized protein (DUF433 family)
MAPGYVELRDGAYRVAGTRVSLDSIMCAFIAGQSAESVQQSFPLLTLEQVYGAIAFYLGNREQVDRYLERQRQDFEAKRAAAGAADRVPQELGRRNGRGRTAGNV